MLDPTKKFTFSINDTGGTAAATLLRFNDVEHRFENRGLRG